MSEEKEIKTWWIFKGTSNFCSELELDDKWENTIRKRPEGFYDVVSDADTVEGGIAVVQYHPPKSDYVNNVDNCLHLFRPLNAEMPRPPKSMVGL